MSSLAEKSSPQLTHCSVFCVCGFRQDNLDIYVDNGILSAIEEWLEPSEMDASLPPLDVQKSMIGVLERLDVDAGLIDRLRECKVGRVVKYMSTDEDVLPDLKKRCQRLIGESAGKRNAAEPILVLISAFLLTPLSFASRQTNGRPS